MEEHLTGTMKSAIEQMKKKEEQGFNYIYANTYNFVYLRANSVMKNETDAQKLIQEVYMELHESIGEIEEDNIYEWLGETVYSLGSLKYRKKKSREAESLEIAAEEMVQNEKADLSKSAEVIKDRLDNLPDLYRAIFYAFYHDHMTVKEIAEVMDETEGVILNRLNYTRKYMIEALEDFKAENQDEKRELLFSVGAVKAALVQWSSEHWLGEAKAQFFYSEICKKIGWKASSICPNKNDSEKRESAGAERTITSYNSDDWSLLEQQFEEFGPKSGMENRKVGVIVGAAALVVALIIGIILFATAEKDSTGEHQQGITNEQNQNGEDQNENTNGEDVNNSDTSNKDTNNEDTNNEDTNNEDTNNEDSNNEDSNNENINGEDTNSEGTDNGEDQVSDSEYILPESGTRALQRSDLENLSKEELRLARNEIFARHGMIFGVEDLDQYFGAKSWYHPTVPSEEFYDKVDMSMIEEENINLIVEVEAERE